MPTHNRNKLSVIYDKRQNDFIVKYPIRCDGALILNHLVNELLLWSMPENADHKQYPYNWRQFNLKDELESRGYDLSTLKFSIELKK
jgi:hypothetical protein